MTKILNKKWNQKKPSQAEQEAYIHPHKHPLVPTSTIIDAIIHFSAVRPITVDKKKWGKLPIDTRYPFILEEVSRLACKEAIELLCNESTQELKQKLSQVIESFGSSPGFTWQWHDGFKSNNKGDDQSAEEDKGGVSENREVDVLLNDIMELEKVKDILDGATPSICSQVQSIFEAAVKVINIITLLSLTNVSPLLQEVRTKAVKPPSGVEEGVKQRKPKKGQAGIPPDRLMSGQGSGKKRKRN